MVSKFKWYPRATPKKRPWTPMYLARTLKDLYEAAPKHFRSGLPDYSVLAVTARREPIDLAHDIWRLHDLLTQTMPDYPAYLSITVDNIGGAMVAMMDNRKDRTKIRSVGLFLGMEMAPNRDPCYLVQLLDGSLQRWTNCFVTRVGDHAWFERYRQAVREKEYRETRLEELRLATTPG